MKRKLQLCFTAFILSASLAFSQWTQTGQDIDGEAAGDFSGHSVSLSANGDRLAIGSYQNNGNGGSSGHVRIYEWQGAVWVQLGADIDGEAAGDYSGWSVSLSADGNRVAIGAYGNDNNGVNSGHVRIYEWQGAAWVQVGADIDGEAAGDSSGWSVSLSGDGSRVAIGAYRNDGNGVDSGHIRIYEWQGAAWVQLGADIDGEAEDDESGFSVSLSADGNRVAVGARFNEGSEGDSGHVRIYEWQDAAWIQLGADIDGEAILDESGFSVSLNADGNRVAVGARFNDGNGMHSGHVRIYEWQGAAWVQLGMDIDGENSFDLSGHSVSLSADGSRVAIGAHENDGNGDGSGHVRIYEWQGASWVQLGADIDGEDANDQSGWSVSLSADGNRVAIGAYLNDGNGIDSGHVRVYESAPPLYTAIPDPYFEFALIEQGMDSEGILDGQVLTADISAVTTLDVTNEFIFDLSGIENFTALEVLNCTNNWISTLDVSNNSSLISLDCSNNQLSALTLVNTLTTLNCSDNRFFGSLDLSAMTLLTNLDTTENYRLFCIEVADEAAANAGVGIYAGWITDGFTTYSENCGMMAKEITPGIKPENTIRESQTLAQTTVVYPNPARDRLYIALSEGRELMAVVLYNMQGERVAMAKSTTIPLNSLAEGIYFVEIQYCDNERIIKKIMISGD